MGGWAIVQSPILRTTITIKRLKMKGYVSLIEYYKRQVSLSNCHIPARPVQAGETRTYGGVRGALRLF